MFSLPLSYFDTVRINDQNPDLWHTHALVFYNKTKCNEQDPKWNWDWRYEVCRLLTSKDESFQVKVNPKIFNNYSKNIKMSVLIVIIADDPEDAMDNAIDKLVA